MPMNDVLKTLASEQQKAEVPEVRPGDTVAVSVRDSVNNTGSANRSLAFSGVSELDVVRDSGGNALTSNGAPLHYHLTTIGGLPALVAYTGSDPGAPPDTSGHKAMIRNTVTNTQPNARLLDVLTSWLLEKSSCVSAILSFPIARCGSR